MEVVQSQLRLEQMESDLRKEITRLHLSPDEASLYVCHKDLKEKAGPNQCIVIAVLTTAYARMLLYDLIARYSRQTVYFGLAFLSSLSYLLTGCLRYSRHR